MRIRSFYIKRRSEYRHARLVGGSGGMDLGGTCHITMVQYWQQRRGEERRAGASRSDEEWKGKRAIEGGEMSITLCHGQLCLVGWLCPSHFPSLTPISWHCLTHSGPLSTGRQKERDQLANQPWQFISLQGLGTEGDMGQRGRRWRWVSSELLICERLYWFTDSQMLNLRKVFFLFFKRLDFKVKVRI